MAVSDVGALKLAHAALPTLNTEDMRTLLQKLLTASASDKPSCFVAVRTARALVEQQQQQQPPPPQPDGTEGPTAPPALVVAPAAVVATGIQPDCGGDGRLDQEKNNGVGAESDQGNGSSSARSNGSSSARSNSSSSARSSSSADSSGRFNSSRAGPTCGSKTKRRTKALGDAMPATIEPVSGVERFLAPMSRMTQAERRQRAKRQRDSATLALQKHYRGWVARRTIASWIAAARVFQRFYRGKVWRHALALASAARARRVANEAAMVAKQAETRRQRAGFERYAREGYVNTAIPEDMKREELLHFASTQIAAACRGLLVRQMIQRKHSWSLKTARAKQQQQKQNALLAQERKGYAREEAARAIEIAAKQRQELAAAAQKLEEHRMRKLKKAKQGAYEKQQREIRAKKRIAEAERAVRLQEDRKRTEVESERQKDARLVRFCNKLITEYCL